VGHNERRLIKVVGQKVIKSQADLSALIPRKLTKAFTTADIAKAAARPRRLAQRMVYCLKSLDCIQPVGKRGNAILYSKVKD
jgi:hypothetical protein